MKFLFLEALAQTLSIMGVCLSVPALMIMIIKGVNSFAVLVAIVGFLLIVFGLLVLKNLQKQLLTRKEA